MSKVAVVTGASKGIGAATAVAFGKAGYDVVINYKSDIKSAQDVAKQVTNCGQKAVIVQADVFIEDGIKQLFREIKEIFNRIDVFVNNAGKPSEAEFGAYTANNIHDSLMANFMSSVLCTQEAAKLIDKGSILFTSSVYGLQFGGNPSLTLYSAGKAAMISFTQTISE